MAKRKSATTERLGGETTTRTRRGSARVAQETLPGLGPSLGTSETLVVARRAPKRAAKVEVTLQLAPTNGPRQSARARQKPAEPTTDAIEAIAATPATPKPAHKSGSQRFSELREALADGWEIVQPIFARPLWKAADDSLTAFNFVLRREQSTRLLTVPSSRSVERFIETRQLQVDYRR